MSEALPLRLAAPPRLLPDISSDLFRTDLIRCTPDQILYSVGRSSPPSEGCRNRCSRVLQTGSILVPCPLRCWCALPRRLPQVAFDSALVERSRANSALLFRVATSAFALAAVHSLLVTLFHFRSVALSVLALFLVERMNKLLRDPPYVQGLFFVLFHANAWINCDVGGNRFKGLNNAL
jgi:hypothetical protein